MKSLVGPAVKSGIFLVVTVLATALLALTIVNGGNNNGGSFKAVFSDVTSLNVGDDIRIAGVRVGEVDSIDLVHRRQAEISFSLQSGIRLTRTVTATVRFRNLIGQRYISLDEGDGSLADPLPGGSTIPLTRTAPALDLTTLFNGFQPLFSALAPKQINELSGELIAVFQGEGPTVDDLLQQTGALTTTLAGRDRVIGEVISNLDTVLTTVNRHGGQLTALISTLSRLVSGLAQDRTALGSAIVGINGLNTQVTDLLARGRPALKTDISRLGALSANLAASSGALNSFLETLPVKLNRIGRMASYGSWLNFYLCGIGGRIPVPGTYVGGVGAQPEAPRCS